MFIFIYQRAEEVFSFCEPVSTIGLMSEALTARLARLVPRLLCICLLAGYLDRVEDPPAVNSQGLETSLVPLATILVRWTHSFPVKALLLRKAFLSRAFAVRSATNEKIPFRCRLASLKHPILPLQ